jgi:signal transduction histidine kinase
MRTELDVALADPDAGVDDLRGMGEAVRETIDRCERLIDSLLLLARSEAASGSEEPVDLAALAADCITDLRGRPQAAEVQMRDRLEPAWTRGEPALVERMIANLVENAIRYNEPGGFLEVSTEVRAGRAFLLVANGGARIDRAEAQTLTEPFRRLNRSRGGFGLGLSIVRTVAEAHGGQVRITAPERGGLEVAVELPALDGAPNVGVGQGSRALTRS